MSDPNSELPVTGTTAAEPQAISVLPVLPSVSQGGTVPPAHRPGWQTTEFWITMCVLVGTVTGAIVGLPPKWMAIAACVSQSAYSISRGLTKFGTSIFP